MERVKLIEHLSELKRYCYRRKYFVYDCWEDHDLSGFIKMDKSKVDIQLWETLVLMHSKYQSELQVIKGFYLRTQIKMIDAQINHLELTTVNKPSILNNPGRFALIIGASTFCILMLIKAISSDHEAGKIVLEFVKSIIAAISFLRKYNVF